MPRKVTAKDVAELAGVSRSAVSMVLNGRADGDIAPDKQEAVRRAAAQLRYRPNSVARSLRSSSSNTIGVVTDAVTTSAFGGAMLTGATRVAAARDYLLLVVDSHRDARVEAEAIGVLQSRQCDALMFVAEGLIAWDPPSAFQDDLSLLVNAFDPQGRVPGVYPDEYMGGRVATQMLLDHGHRRIVCLSGGKNAVAGERRVQAHRDLMAEQGLQPLVIDCGWELDRGLEVGGRALDEAQPTAIICANDRVAAGVFLAAAHRGLRIPEDLSVVGYDDDPNVAAQLGLSTVLLPHLQMGEKAAELILAALDGADLPTEDVLVPVQPVPRASIAAPATG
ncbi:LacI family DNA-binding transcriptional regulator [Luteococcus sp. Sow4_B9]|uniref:LacI family DNA-binding transcriptional regulator n=1 Tax=Luteococcus sp. Sow4_B9 TaxID=3438792 RepID=UPI003F9BAACF